MSNDRLQPPWAGGAAPDTGGLSVVQPGYVAPPRGAVVIDKCYSIFNLVPVSTGGVETQFIPDDGTELSIPSNYQLRLSAMGFSSMSPLFLTNVAFRVTCNRRPVETYGIQRACLGTLHEPTPIHLHLPGGGGEGVEAEAVIRFFATNLWDTSTSGMVLLRIIGWIYGGE